MALPLRGLNRQCLLSLQKPVQWKLRLNYPSGFLKNCKNCASFSFNTTYNLQQKYVGSLSICRKYTTQPQNDKPETSDKPGTNQEKKVSLFQRFKQMTRDYWYVLLPVHGVTSLMWFGGFYYLVRSGVDILSFLETLGFSEKVISQIRNSGAGYFALAFACYKIVTPLRYTLTLGGTTFAIKKLTTYGWIKPVPSKERIKEIFQEKRENLQDKFQESKIQMKDYKEQMKEKRAQVMEEMARYKTDIRNVKDKEKKM